MKALALLVLSAVASAEEDEPDLRGTVMSASRTIKDLTDAVKEITGISVDGGGEPCKSNHDCISTSLCCSNHQCAGSAVCIAGSKLYNDYCDYNFECASRCCSLATHKCANFLECYNKCGQNEDCRETTGCCS